MEIAELDNAIKVLNASLSHIKWRLKSSALRRLQIDILALCTRMRPVVMVDYGGKMPELQERLCALLKHCQMGSPTFENLKVMIIEDMIYLIHVKELAEHVNSSLNSDKKILFVDLEQDPPKMIAEVEKSPMAVQLTSIQKLFSTLFPPDGVSSWQQGDSVADATCSSSQSSASQSSEFIDLTSCLQGTEVMVPTLNGWLLGYPVVYLFSKEHSAEAIYNLSSKYLHLFKIVVSRNDAPSKESGKEELFSFSVPYDLSMGGMNERWAKTLMEQMDAKWGRCKHAWRSLQLEISECNPLAVVL